MWPVQAVPGLPGRSQHPSVSPWSGASWGDVLRLAAIGLRPWQPAGMVKRGDVEECGCNSLHVGAARRPGNVFARHTSKIALSIDDRIQLLSIPGFGLRNWKPSGTKQHAGWKIVLVICCYTNWDLRPRRGSGSEACSFSLCLLRNIEVEPLLPGVAGVDGEV